MRNLDWDAPAKLFHWPSVTAEDDDNVFDTLWEALEAVGSGGTSTAWIVTQNGDILTPRMIDTLRERPRTKKPRRRASPLALLGWSRAA